MSNAGLSELLQSVAHSDPAAKDLIDMICGEEDFLDEFGDLAGMEIEEQLKVLSEPSDLPKADVEVMVNMLQGARQAEGSPAGLRALVAPLSRGVAVTPPARRLFGTGAAEDVALRDLREGPVRRERRQRGRNHSGRCQGIQQELLAPMAVRDRIGGELGRP